MDKLIIKIKENKENYLIIASALLLIFVVIYSFGKNDFDKKSDEHKVKGTLAPALEEIAQKEGKDISAYMPKPKIVLTLEEIAQKEGKDISAYMPKPKNVLSLEELNN